MSSLREIPGNLGVFGTIQCLNLQSTGVLSSTTMECTNLVSGDVTTNTIECSTLVSSGDVSGATLTGNAVVCSGNVSGDNLTVETKLTTSQFQLIPPVPSLGYTLTSDIAGNATWTAPLADYPSYKQKTPKIILNSPANSIAPFVVVSSDGSMIVVVYRLNATLQTQFQTFLYESDTWFLDSTITTPLTNNANYYLCLADGNDLLAISNLTANQVVVYRRTAGAWVQVGAMLDLNGTYTLFGRNLVINSGKQMLAVQTQTDIVFYLISVSTLTLAGVIIIPLVGAGQTGLDISLDFRILVTGNYLANNNVGRVTVFVRAALDPLTAWSLLQTINPYSISASNVYAGASVSLSRDGSTLAVGASEDAINSPASVGPTGAVLMFNYVTGVGFVQGQKIVPVDYSYQSTQTVAFGGFVQLNFAGDTLVIGGWYDQQATGSIWVYVRDKRGLWIQNGNKYRGNDLNPANANQGYTVAIARGNASVVVASVGRDDPSNKNAMVIYQ